MLTRAWSQSAPPRVAYLVKRYPRYSETFVVNEILAHEEAGLAIEIFALKPSNDTHFQDAIARVRAPVRILPNSGLKAAAFWQQIAEAQAELPGLHAGLQSAWREDVAYVHQAIVLARALRASGISHVHAHFGSSPATVARLAACFAGISYSFTAHAKDIYHADVDAAAFVGRHAERATIVTVSDFNRRFLIDERNFRPAQIVRIYNGLDLERFEFDGSSNRPRRVVAIGRLVEKKGFADLIDACAVMKAECVDFDCRIIGAGPLESELRARIADRNLSGRVSLTGPLPQESIRKELSDAALFAAPCVVAGDGDRDGVPTTLLEAMALGVPCVSTDVTGIPEVVKDGSTGRVVPQHDPKALASVMTDLLEHPENGGALATRARRLIEERFDARLNTAQLRQIFRADVGTSRSDSNVAADRS